MSAFIRYSTLLLLLLGGIKVNAQSQEEAIKQVITNLFTAMQQGDTAKIRACFVPESRLQSALLNPKTGETKLCTEPLDSFIRISGLMQRDSIQIEERLISFDIKIDDPLASVWAGYEFYFNKRLSHSGIDAFQLLRTAQGWKILQITDTRKRK